MDSTPNPHRRPIPKVPDSIQDDPFEFDWPWPGMLPPESEAPQEPSAVDRASERVSEEEDALEERA